MRCYMEGCQNRTLQRCRQCGQPVCVEHGSLGGKFYPVPSPVLPFVTVFYPNIELVCDHCANKLREPEYASSKRASSA
jgi:hypothetical protein